MIKFEDLEIKNKFSDYPTEIRTRMLYLRSLIIDTYKQNNEKKKNKNTFQECLKWGEPSYLFKFGSTIRIDWKFKNPKFLNIYFNCQSLLVETFREVYGEELTFEKNRAILINVDKKFPEKILAHCFELTMNYHKIKHLPLLGV
ncbi:MAG: hypothetical protein COA86_18180 [Kangiella sp.]|nr:MAG: hypothetical protein COA86_18180 [Kangiella sp.]